MKNNNTAITKGGDSWSAWLTQAGRTKYPIFLQSLFMRIQALAAAMKLDTFVQQYPATAQGRKQMNSDLRGKGGIYIWWCKPTGLFYLGSALQFITGNNISGRLNDYWIPSVLTGSILGRKGRTVSKGLARDLLIYGHHNFVVIIVAQYNVGTITQKALHAIEQVWMLLIPTYNRSLRVGTPVNHRQTQESVRASLSDVVHVYEVNHNGQGIVNPGSTIVAGSHKVILGVKHLVRTGITCLNGMYMKLVAFDVQAVLISQALYEGWILITKTPITNESTWVPTLMIINAARSAANSHHKRGKVNIWVYQYNSDPNYCYIEKDLVAHHNNISDAITTYGITSSTYQRMRRYLLPSKGLVHSNVALHKLDLNSPVSYFFH